MIEVESKERTVPAVRSSIVNCFLLMLTCERTCPIPSSEHKTCNPKLSDKQEAQRRIENQEKQAIKFGFVA